MHGKNKIENMDPFTLGTAVPQVKKRGRKTGLRRTGIPATCEARTDYREERGFAYAHIRRRRAHSCKRFYLNLQSREQGGPLLLPDHTLLGRISFSPSWLDDLVDPRCLLDGHCIFLEEVSQQLE